MSTREIVKKVENAILYNDGTIRIDNVRLSFPHLAQPQENENDNGQTTKKFGVVGMLPKSTHGAAKDLIKQVIEKLISDNEAKVAKENWFLKNGDDKEQEEYAGHFIINTSESRRPAVRDRKGNLLEVDEIEQMFYGGCWGNLLIRPWYFNGKAKNSSKTYPKRISCGIVAVQFVRDDESFGQGRISDEGVFGAIGDGDDSFGGHDNDDL